MVIINCMVCYWFQGIICTGLAYGLISWTIERKGPLYVSVFAPLTLVITAVVSWALLHDQLYVGTYEINYYMHFNYLLIYNWTFFVNFLFQINKNGTVCFLQFCLFLILDFDLFQCHRVYPDSFGALFCFVGKE